MLTTPTIEAEAEAAMTSATMFNGYIGAQVFHALHDLGVLRRLEEGVTEVTELASGADPDRLTALLSVMSRLDLVTLDAGTASLTAAGRDLVRQQGFFTWCVGGHGELWRNLAGMTTGESRFGQDVRRDGAQIARGCAEVDRAMLQAIQNEVCASIDFTTIADLGCGDGSRLLQLCAGDPRRRGTGIDINPEACALAAERVDVLGISDRVGFVQADVLELLGSERTFPGIDLVVSIFMLHDMFASTDDHVGLVRSLRALFPDARYFLLADTTAQDEVERQGAPPVFSLGFELAHAFMGVKLQNRSTYEEAFEAGGLGLARREPFGVPSTWLYLLETRS